MTAGWAGLARIVDGCIRTCVIVATFVFIGVVVAALLGVR
jgi:hypothetical protein